MRRNAKILTKPLLSPQGIALMRLTWQCQQGYSNASPPKKLRYHSTSLVTSRTPTTMSDLKQLFSFSTRRLMAFTSILILSTAAICGAEEPQASNPVDIFQPHETQHGFAEFDSPPDFFEDTSSTTESAPYGDYSDSPNLPSSDHKPRGLFASMVFAESVEEDRTIRRGHILVPVNATNIFPSSAKAVHLVFAVHEHLAPFQVIGRLFPEMVPDADANQWIDEDIADLALEDESGYLKFFTPKGSWQPGRYRVDVYVGYMVNTMNKMGTMRFSIEQNPTSSALKP